MVYAIGGESAVVFSRDPSTGALTEVSCAASEVSSCASFPSLSGIGGTAVSPDGRYVYVAARGDSAVFAFGVGLTVATASASATRAGIARVRVRCPTRCSRACAGRLALTRVQRRAARHGRGSARLARVTAGGSGRFALRPGTRR